MMPENKKKTENKKKSKTENNSGVPITVMYEESGDFIACSLDLSKDEDLAKFTEVIRGHVGE